MLKEGHRVYRRMPACTHCETKSHCMGVESDELAVVYIYIYIVFLRWKYTAVGILCTSGVMKEVNLQILCLLPHLTQTAAPQHRAFGS